MNGERHHYEVIRVPIRVSFNSATSEVASFNVKMADKISEMNSLIEAQNAKFISQSNSPFVCNDSVDYLEVNGKIMEPATTGNCTGFISDTGIAKYDYLEIKDLDGKVLLDDESNELVAKIEYPQNSDPNIGFCTKI